MTSRHPWTEKEDQILASLVKKYGTSNWILISEKMQTKADANQRTGKQCRQRWHNQLDPKVSKKSWTLQQQNMMFRAHRKYGNRWAEIAGQLENRTDSDVKNHFYAVIRKSLRRISKLFGMKNSTQKIKNLKPTFLSRLLQSNNQKVSKETSEALFKFITSRQNLNLDSIQKQNKKLLQDLVQKISNEDNLKNKITEKKQRKKSFINLQKNQQTLKKIPTTKNMSKSSKKASIVSKKSKIINKDQNQKPQNLKKNSKFSLNKQDLNIKEKQEIKVESQPFEVFFQQKNQKKSSIFENISPTAGFQWIDEKNQRKSYNTRKLWLNKSQQEEKFYFNELNIDVTPRSTKRRSSVVNEMHRILSNNDFQSIYVTPRNPTPGVAENLFFSWNIPHKLTIEQIQDEREAIRKQIQKNNN